MNYPYYQQPNLLNCVLNFDSKLYIGDAQGFQGIQNYNIGAVISVATEQQFYINNNDIEHMILQVHDRPHIDIQQHFTKTNQFIEEQMNNGKNVLVHCVAGISRSASIVLAYLMYSQEWSLQQSINYLKSVRPQICPNPGFIKQLLKFEEKLLGTIQSNLTKEHTPYFSVQKSDTIIPEGPPVYRNNNFQDYHMRRTSSFVSPPPLMYQVRYF